MAKMNEHSCAREQELIGFMYQELSEVEALAFQRHLNECASCRMDLSSFRNVRESVLVWRNESLASVGLSDGSAISSPAPLTERRRSARAAVREFFNLSPLWMKGALAFTTVVFCVLAVITVARLRQDQPVVIVASPAQPIRSQEETEVIVKERVQHELERIRSSKSSETVATADHPTQPIPISKRVSKGFRDGNTSYTARRPLSKTERVQLAADLRLLSSNSDSELDLLQDRINQ
jgi:anti-sigma factor RsiW